MSKLGRDMCMDRLMILLQNSHILQSTFKYSSYYYMYMHTTLYNHICYCMIICAAISQNNAIDKFTVLRTCAMLRNVKPMESFLMKRILLRKTFG